MGPARRQGQDRIRDGDPQVAVEERLESAWRSEGWLHLRGFFSAEEAARINLEIDELWRRRPGHVTVDDLDQGQRCRMSRLDPVQRAHRVKINDLYLTSAAVRRMLLDGRLTGIVRAILDDQPVLCNSLNLERSSAQEYHADSLYMTPPTPNQMVACWTALEDVQPGSGPLRLYPKSHQLPPFVFSDGSRHAIPAELPRWAGHMQRELDERSMSPHVVHAKVGDVVLWHADLLHGAEEIREAGLTRRSLVAHYYGLADCVRSGYRLGHQGDGYWLKRRPQPVGLASRVLSGIERRLWRVRAAWASLRGAA